MPTYNPRTRIYLSDTIDLCIGRGVEIRLRCSNKPLAGPCGHVAIVQASYLADLCTERGWGRGLTDFGRHLRCTKCGWHWPHVEVVGQV